MRRIMTSILLAIFLPLLPTAADPASPAPIPYVAHTVEVPDGLPSLACVQGDTLHIVGGYMSHGYDHVLLECDHLAAGSMEASAAAGASANYTFSWKPNTVGTHAVRVIEDGGRGQVARVRLMIVQVLPSSPAFFGATPDASFTDVPAHMCIGASDFVPVRAAFTFDGQDVAPGSDTLGCSLPTSAKPTGTYKIHLRAYDASGAMLDVGERTVSVPERGTLASGAAYTLAKAGDRMPLSVSLLPGLPVKSVSYLVDGQDVCDTSDAPYAGGGDLSSFKTGQHKVVAHMVMADGHSFDSPPTTVTYRNQVQDDLDAKAAKEEADREAAVAVAEANARAAAEAAKDQGPMGPARRLLRWYFQNHPELQMTLQDVKDVRKSDSEIFPSDIYAVVIRPGLDPQQLIFSANMGSQTVSDLLKRWP
jgi:hypothetical protein